MLWFDLRYRCCIIIQDQDTELHINDKYIDSYLGKICTEKIHMMHRDLACMVQLMPADRFDKIKYGLKAGLLRWLQTPRSIGELSGLLVLMNRGLIVCTGSSEGDTDDVWDGEIIKADFSHIPFHVEGGVGEPASDVTSEYDELNMKTFEEELKQLTDAL